MAPNVVTILPLQDAVGLSIQGPRPYQEDAAILIGSRYAVFDGLGGHAGGDVASSAAVQGFSLPAPDLQTAVGYAEAAVYEAQRRSPSAMTTMVAVEIMPGELHYAWSGDSRIYLFRPRSPRGPVLSQLTQDHAIPGTNTVLRCLGTPSHPEFGSRPYQPDDVLLLCSDGLHNATSMRRIGAAFMRGGSAGELAQRILNLAARDPCDNTTLVVVRLGGISPTSP